MARPLAPHAQQVALRDRLTGEVFHRWSVDAREFVTLHPEQYEYVTGTEDSGSPLVATSPAETLAPPASAPPVDYEDALDALGYAQLQDLARRAGIQNINLKKPAMIAALKPHFEAGTLSLVTPAQVLGIPPAPRP